MTKLALAAAFVTGSAMMSSGAAAATTVTGKLLFGDYPQNEYDAKYMRLPSQCMNAKGTTVAIGNFDEFCYMDLVTTTIGANFAKDGFYFYARTNTKWGLDYFTQEFVFSDADYLNGITLDSSNYGTLNYTVSGNKLTIRTSAPVPNIEAQARFSFNRAVAAVPEPATWAMMLAGFGMIGAAARVRRRTVAVA